MHSKVAQASEEMHDSDERTFPNQWNHARAPLAMKVGGVRRKRHKVRRRSSVTSGNRRRGSTGQRRPSIRSRPMPSKVPRTRKYDQHIKMAIKQPRPGF